jgi:hypothetical protein
MSAHIADSSIADCKLIGELQIEDVRFSFGDWGFGVGRLELPLGRAPFNLQSPNEIRNPQSPIPNQSAICDQRICPVMVFS